jgi:SAM-dependent methyltransferase
MGIALYKLQMLRRFGVLPNGGNVLDIGSSNLYAATIQELHNLAADFGQKLDGDFIERLSRGSAYGHGITRNESFVGELLERLGLTYLAFDIANGYRTQILDLNSEALPDKLRGTFDTVLNFGTTEHVINQLNAFRVIHDAVKVGGQIVHELPTVGYIDHGYFCYTPRFFFDLAGYNEYEVIDFAYQGPLPGNDIHAIVRDYQSYFPALTSYLTKEGLLEPRKPSAWVAISRALGLKQEPTPPNISSFLIVRKTKDLPLRLPMETSTSVVVDGAP